MVGNTQETYAIRQNNNGATYVNGYNSAVRIRNSNVDIAAFSYSGKYTQLKLFPKSQTDGTSKIQLHNQLGQSWAMEVNTNQLDFGFSDNQIKFSISRDTMQLLIDVLKQEMQELEQVSYLIWLHLVIKHSQILINITHLDRVRTVKRLLIRPQIIQ